MVSIISNNDIIVVGPANYDGHMIFDCVPAEGTIAAGSSSKINVHFNPDHASALFADQARVYISNKVCPHVYVNNNIMQDSCFENCITLSHDS